ncbi:MAG: hypothetical protein DRN81_01135 [Thermoproteota archaeon]|nr:MAG: hypothetical protein DRN81_01135 [Candidatus Korarchaeota archaeon]
MPPLPKVDLQELIDQSGGWDWEDAHVSQAYISPHGIDTKESIAINDIVESGTVLIAAGPSDLDKASEDPDGFRVVPIGLIETAQISMNKPLSRIFEIGSKLSYIIPGRTVGGISLSRVFFDGPSLLKAVYMGEVKADFATQDKKFAKFASNPYFVDGAESYQKFANIGSGNLAMNLASSFFEQPVGLAFYFKDQQDDTVGQTYFEGCRISTLNLGISANMNVLTESINMEFVRCRPILTAASKDYVKGENLADLNIVSEQTNWDQTAIDG